MAGSSKLSVQDKIKFIENSQNLGSVPFEYFPPVQSDEYYFISYSHKDYKEVFKDIFNLQCGGNRKISVWYDSGLTAGVDWEIEADNHIYDYGCKGVIFYISENSVRSKSIHKEIEYVKKSGKSYLSVNLPVQSSEERRGEYLSADELLRFAEPDIDADDEKLKTLAEVFNERVTYLKLSDDIERKIKNIIALIRPPLLEYDIVENGLSYSSEWRGVGMRSFAVLKSVNDVNIKRVDIPSIVVRDGKEYPVAAIGGCAFANCKRLQSVVLPQSVFKILPRAFYGCEAIESVIINENVTELPEGVFEGCKSLKEIKLNCDIVAVGDRAFYGCKSLTELRFTGIENRNPDLYMPRNLQTVGKDAFKGCDSLESIVTGERNDRYFKSKDGVLYKVGEYKPVKLKRNNKAELTAVVNSSKICWASVVYAARKIKPEIFFVPKNVKGRVEIMEGVKEVPVAAFENCVNLKEVQICEGVKTIKRNAFAGCRRLEQVILPKSLKQIGDYAFSVCKKLEKVSLPKNVTFVGNNAFYHLTKIEQ